MLAHKISTSDPSVQLLQPVLCSRLWWLPLLQHPRLQKPHRRVRCAEHLQLWPRTQDFIADFLGFDKDIISHAQQRASVCSIGSTMETLSLDECPAHEIPHLGQPSGKEEPKEDRQKITAKSGLGLLSCQEHQAPYEHLFNYLEG